MSDATSAFLQSLEKGRSKAAFWRNRKCQTNTSPVTELDAVVLQRIAALPSVVTDGAEKERKLPQKTGSFLTRAFGGSRKTTTTTTKKPKGERKRETFTISRPRRVTAPSHFDDVEEEVIANHQSGPCYDWSETRRSNSSDSESSDDDSGSDDDSSCDASSCSEESKVADVVGIDTDESDLDLLDTEDDDSESEYDEPQTQSRLASRDGGPCYDWSMHRANGRSGRSKGAKSSSSSNKSSSRDPSTPKRPKGDFLGSVSGDDDSVSPRAVADVFDTAEVTRGSPEAKGEFQEETARSSCASMRVGRSIDATIGDCRKSSASMRGARTMDFSINSESAALGSGSKHGGRKASASMRASRTLDMSINSECKALDSHKKESRRSSVSHLPPQRRSADEWSKRSGRTTEMDSSSRMPKRSVTDGEASKRGSRTMDSSRRGSRTMDASLSRQSISTAMDSSSREVSKRGSRTMDSGMTRRSCTAEASSREVSKRGSRTMDSSMPRRSYTADMDSSSKSDRGIDSSMPRRSNSADMDSSSRGRRSSMDASSRNDRATDESDSRSTRMCRRSSTGVDGDTSKTKKRGSNRMALERERAAARKERTACMKEQVEEIDEYDNVQPSVVEEEKREEKPAKVSKSLANLPGANRRGTLGRQNSGKSMASSASNRSTRGRRSTMGQMKFQNQMEKNLKNYEAPTLGALTLGPAKASEPLSSAAANRRKTRAESTVAQPPPPITAAQPASAAATPAIDLSFDASFAKFDDDVNFFEANNW